MDTYSFIGQVLSILIPIIATALGTIITVYVTKWAEQAKETKFGKLVKYYIEFLEKVVTDVVQGLNQTTVLALKEAAKDGKLTPEEIEAIRADAKAQILAILGARGIEVLSKAFGDLDKLIACNVERAVLEAKEAA